MSYEVVLQNKYYLRELIESISLTESLDQIAYQASITLSIPGIFRGSNPVRKSGSAACRLVQPIRYLCFIPAWFGSAAARLASSRR